MTPASSNTRSQWWLIAVPLALFVVRWAQRFDATSVWDDGFMFVRYADSLLATGVPAFWIGGPGTYGLTSPGFLAIAAPVRMLFPHNPVLAALVASSLAGVAFLAMLVVLVRAACEGSSRRRVSVIAFGAIALAPATESLVTHFTSGMDTMFALACLSLFILLAFRYERFPSNAVAWALGVLGGLALWIRPDLLLLTLAFPAARIVWGPDARARFEGAQMLTAALAVMALELAVAMAMLHSPVPLAFFAKSAGLYGPGIRDAYRAVPAGQLLRFVLGHALLFAALAWAIARSPRGWWAQSSPLEKGLLAGALAFVAYYLLAVLQIMYYAQRFYYPLLPVVAFLTARAWSRVPAATPPRPRFAMVLAAVIVVAALARPVWLVATDRHAPLAAGGRFDVAADYRANWRRYWPALDALAPLPDDVVIATTEVGRPLAMNPGKRILDLAGLNETSLVLGDPDAAHLLRRVQPDFVYMPHPDYAAIAERIERDPWFASHYATWTADRLGSDMGVAVLRDGPHAPRLRAIVDSLAGGR